MHPSLWEPDTKLAGHPVGAARERYAARRLRNLRTLLYWPSFDPKNCALIHNVVIESSSGLGLRTGETCAGSNNEGRENWRGASWLVLNGLRNRHLRREKSILRIATVTRSRSNRP